MYYLIANEQVENTEKTIKHVYDISQFYGKVLDSMQALLENDKKNGIENDYSIIETDGNEFRKEFFQTFLIKYEQKRVLERFRKMGYNVIPTFYAERKVDKCR